MEINTGAFCGISKSQDWQNWLLQIAPDLHQDLLVTLKAKKGCRANSNKMQDIYLTLYERDKGDAFEDFIRRRFPYLIKKDHRKINLPKKDILKHQKVAQIARKKQTRSTPLDYSELNKHKVFPDYKPHILTFPQKLILVDDPAILYQRVQQFIKDKLAVDYLIIDDRGYIEYFLPKYAAIINKYPKEKRDIYQYRLRLKQQNA